MSKVKFNLKKGDIISIGEEKIKLDRPHKIKGHAMSDTAPEPVQGNHEQDEPQAIDKGTVLSILKKEIDRLEKEENRWASFLDDDFGDLIEEKPASLSTEIGIPFQIMNLKTILKKINSL